jgi:hypothetical protein
MRRRATAKRVTAKRAIGALAVVGLAYVAAPYVCLWRVYRAVESGDAATLAQIVDWDSVRRGMKQDIAEGIIGLPPPQTVASNTLPAFGSGFVTGIAAHVVDQQVTPQNLVQVVRSAQLPASGAAPAEPAPATGIGSVERAFFTSPTSFVVSIRLPGEDAGDSPLRVELGLRGGGWKVVRAWIPQDLMDEAKFHT